MIRLVVILSIVSIVLALKCDNSYRTRSLTSSSSSVIRCKPLYCSSNSISNANSNSNSNSNSFPIAMTLIDKAHKQLLRLPLLNTKNALVLLLNTMLFIITTLMKPSKVIAATSTILNKVSGWDLYGRIPFDEWLFSTWALCDPNLLKKSYVEAIVFELPDVMANLKRRKRINEILTLGKGFGYLIGAMFIAAIMYKGAMASQLRKINQKGGDNYTPTSAISKKAARKGKEIDNMDGWLDMEQDATDDDDDDDVDKKKKNKRKSDDDDDE